ncbi:MAG: phytoene/squalene synthase family protein [Bryobacteraceae bacterium]
MTPTSLPASYAHCRRLTRAKARNFHYAFLLLDRPRRDAISAIYAFMRRCDDFGDDDALGDGAARRRLLAGWRESLEAALDGRAAGDPLWPAFHDAVQRYSIPPRYFFEMIDGVTSDLEPRRVATRAELERYCYQVASVAGLSLIHVLGFVSDNAVPLAERCGYAFQLTNILRDVGEDAARGRIYLPAEDLVRFGVEPADLRPGGGGEAFRRLMRFEAARARGYYDESAGVIELVDPAGRRALWALITIYRRLLDRIERLDYDVLDRRVSLSALEKTGVALRALLR